MNPMTSAARTREWGCLLGGEFRTARKPLEVRSPWDDSLVGVTFEPDANAIEQAVQTAQAAFHEMAALPTWRRAEILRAIAAGLEARREEAVRLLALEAGKPVKAGRVEVDRAIFTFRYAAEESQRIPHDFQPLDLIPTNEGRWAIVRRFPIGPVFAMTAFNFPVNLVAHKLGPALAAGNSIISKPSPKTPLTSLLIAEIAVAAGVPAGGVQVFSCPDEMTQKLVADERFKMLTFTGSAAVGWKLKALAGKKRVTLELGGNAGVIVHQDADLNLAANRCAFGGFSFAGQSCISAQRIFAHRAVYEKFLDAMASRARALVLGDPLDEKTDIGPMIRPGETQRVESWVNEAVAAGAKIIAGGKRHDRCFEPTVLTATRPEMRVNCLEVFGPVVTVEPYDDFDAALAQINASPFGLQAGVFTRDLGLIHRAFERLEVGGVMANDSSTFRADQMPYGGMKDSGFGREGVRYAIEEMTERKVLVLNLGS